MATAVSEQVIDLATAEGRKTFNKQRDEGNDEPPTELREYLNGDTCLYFGDTPIVRCDGETFIIHQGIVLFAGHGFLRDIDKDTLKKAIKDSRYMPSAIVVPYDGAPKGFKRMMVLNGDEDSQGSNSTYPITGDYSGDGFPTLSVECLRRLYLDNPSEDPTAKDELEGQRNVAERLGTGVLQLVDFNPDETKALTEAQKEKVKAARKKCQSTYGGGYESGAESKIRAAASAGAGFTMLNPTSTNLRDIHFHRAATVLLYDTKLKKSFLIGQDDGSYFGVLLADNPKSIADAYTSLVPAEIRGRKGWSRQGEWFAVPVDEKDLPAETDCVALIEDTITLPIDNADSAHHVVHTGEGRVAKDGTIYANGGNVNHSEDDHPELNFDGWHSFHHNTAVKAVSVRGVD